MMILPHSALFFFFSSRRRHTRYIGDWSSDVCSSDLGGLTFATSEELLAAIEPPSRSIAASSSSEVANVNPPELFATTSVSPPKIGRASCRERKDTSQGTANQKIHDSRQSTRRR